MTATGVNDALADGNIVYVIATAAATSTDGGYNGLNPADVSLTNVDDETAGVTVSPASGPTTEVGGQATFSLVLNTQPTANVTIALGSSDTSEGTISTPSLTFTTANWSTPQTVTVTGVNDDIDDDNVVYTIVTSAATSPDASYNALNPADVSVTNVDDDVAGFIVSPASGPTTEAGGQASFTVRLTSQPIANVSVGLSSTDLTEGTVAPASLTFTSANWSTPQTVTVTGVNDASADGNIVFSIATAAATSTDTKFSGINPGDVSVTNVDDETAGVTVSAASGPTTEVGGQATFTVVLSTQPTANVTVGLTSSDLTEGTVSVASLTFTTVNWSTPQTVTVTGVNDDVDDGDIAYSIVTAPATSTDPSYGSLNPADVAVTNVDDETAGFTVSAASGPTTESGGQATFTVRLTSQPTANVTVGLTSSDLTEGTVSPASLTFTTANWSIPQTGTITGVNDALADGNINYAVVTAAATSTDPRYSGQNPGDVSVTNVDDETAGITVSPAGAPTTEIGGQATFTVVLNTQPNANVTVGLTSGDLTEGTVLPVSLTFTTANWSTPQTVTVTGVNDDLDDDNVVYAIVTGAATSTDAGYNGVNAADVLVTNVDDDTAGFTVSAASGPTAESGAQATFTVRLTSQPTASVSIGLTSSDLTEGTVAPASLTFTTANWNTLQTVTATGVNDDLDDDNIVYAIVTAAATSADPKYLGQNPPDVSFTNVDDDAAGFVVSAPSGPTTELGGQATFTVRLASQPTASVTIGVSSSDLTEGTVSPASLTFTTANWNIAQTVTATGVNDLLVDGNIVYSIVLGAATSTDPRYSGVNPADVAITNNDNDAVGITISAPSGPTTEALGQATFTAVLNSQPTANVTIGFSSSDLTEGTVAPASLTFTTANWSTPQTVTATGVNDDVDDDNIVYAIITAAATSTDANYGGFDAVDVALTNVDDDAAGFVITPASGPTTESGAQATFTMRLASQPTADVGIALTSSDLTEGTVAPPSLTFTTGNWSTPQTVTATGVDDLTADGNISYSIVTAAATSSDAKYGGVDPADVGFTNIDNETPGITVTPASGPTTEIGGTATFTIVLNTQPTASVTVGLSSNDLTEGTVAPASAVFTTVTWSTPQTVTVTGVNDDLDDGNIAFTIVTAQATSTDGVYAAINPADIAVTNVDDDAVGFILAPPSGPTTEAGGQATFTLRLTSQPTANVSVGVSSNDLTEGTVAPASLTFTTATWSTPQTVTVTGVNDAIDDDNVVYTILTAAATSSDVGYAGQNPPDVLVTNVDDADAAGITVNPTSGLVTSEAGGQAVFTIVLNSEPVANVTVGVSSSDLTEGTVSPASVTFTNLNWSTPQAITVTGVNDAIDDDPQPFTVVTAAATSSDTKYTGLNAADVSVTNNDDADTAGITVNPTSGLVTTEAGGQATFTIVLTSEPVADVTVGVTSTDLTEGTVSPASVTFTNLNWSTPRTVTITGVADVLDDGDQAFAVTTASASSTDPKYSGINPADVSVTNNDVDAAQLSINDVSVTETDAGTVNAGFTVTMSVPSTQTVTVQYATANGTAAAPGDYTAIGLTTLTFNPGVTTQPVTVVVASDVLDEANETFNVNLSSPSNATISDNQGVGTITDNDPTPSLSINDVTVTETDAGTVNANFTVTLSAVSGQTVTVQYATANATASAPADYTAIGLTTLTFNPGVTTQPVIVVVASDVLDEANETFNVNLSSPSNATISDNQGVGTITDNDPTPSLSINDVTVTETDAGTVNANFTVTLSAVSGQTVTVQYATANATASAPADYTAIGLTTLTFNPGVTTQPVIVVVASDVLDEANETFNVNLSSPSNATISDNQGVGTITDNDPTPSLSINDVTVTEGDGPVSANFTVSLSAPSGQTVTVQYATSNGSATSPSDYTAIGLTTLTFNPGVTTQPVSVTVVGDLLDEASETFTVTLSSPASATIADGTALGTITDNDPAPSITINDVSVTEGNGATVNANFTVSLSENSGQTITVQYATSDGTATAPADYTAIGLTTLTFNPGSTSQPVTVTVQGDLLDELNETFNVNLSNPSNATIADNQGVGTINDNDPTPTLSIGDVTVTEGDAGTVNANFTVTLSAASGQTVTVQYATSNGTATAPADYAAIGLTTLTFTPGVTTQPVTIVVQGDQIDEANDTYTVTLSSPSNATLLDGTGLGTITDDDTADFTVLEFGGNTTVGEAFGAGSLDSLSVVLTAEPVSNVVLDVTSGDTGEVSVLTGTVTFTTGNWDTPQTISLASANDDVDDGNQVTTVTIAVNDALSDNSWDPLVDKTVSVTTIDDDIAGFDGSPTGGTTVVSEDLTTDSIEVVLNSQPVSNVVINASSDDPSEATLVAAQLTFTSANWNVPQWFVVIGVHDEVVDGTIPSTVTLSVNDALSDDAFDSVADRQYTVTTLDND
ncbi:MAG: Calx-beta domain-containing protein [Longimicrobiales bacterium]